MIKFKCDICGKQERDLNTIIFYKRKIDYCNNKNCIKKILNAEKQFTREIKYQNTLFDCCLRSKEKKLLKEIKNNTKEEQ